MFYLSAELRWFISGKLPAQIVDRFGESEFADQQLPRTDTYLVFPNAQTVGVKVREGNFEVKTLVKTSDKVKVSHILSGRIEVWEKWSFSKESADFSAIFNLKNDPYWIPVKKTRWLRKFAYKNGGIQEIQARENYPDCACQVEIAEVVARDEYFWTLNLEGYRGDDSGERVLKDSIEKIKGDVGLADLINSEQLEKAYSKSYPAWMAGL